MNCMQVEEVMSVACLAVQMQQMLLKALDTCIQSAQLCYTTLHSLTLESHLRIRASAT